MHAFYNSPLSRRYASEAMLRLFSEETKFKTWRALWVALAEQQRALGLPITQEQIDALKAKQNEIDYDLAETYEAKLRHDVMAHVHAYGDACPQARGILHLGATSCYVGDNTDLILLREGLRLIRRQLIQVMRALSDFARRYRALPCLGFTHFQAAQPVTVGKRACLWLHDLTLDLEQLDHTIKQLKFLGCRGTTGTQASFMTLFEGDEEKCQKLDEQLAQTFGFEAVYPVSGQTYSRKVDIQVMSCLASLAVSAHKFANDLRLLQHLKEVEEPFAKDQIGSSAMAYKRNPMRSERMTALARFVIALQQNPLMTAAEQWLERTLDDSANRRLSLSEGFLATDAILRLYLNIASGLVVYPNRCAHHLQEELPFMASETLLMEAVKQGGDRQTLHEVIRVHSQAAAARVKEEGLSNDLLERLDQDEAFPMDRKQMSACLDPQRFTGFATQQVDRFLARVEALLQQAQADDPVDPITAESVELTH